MANLYYDVLRLETSGATGVADVLRNKQTGHENAGTYRMGRKLANGTMKWWTPDGYIRATGVLYTNTVYPTVNTVQDMLDVIGYSGVNGSTGLAGATGAQAQQGTTGLQGVTGIQGVTGVQGATGSLGLTGLSTNYITKVASDGLIINSSITDDGTTIQTNEKVIVGATGVADAVVSIYENNTTRDCFTGGNGTLCLRNADTTSNGGDVGIELRSYHAWVAMMIERRVTNDYFHLYNIRSNMSWFRTVDEILEFNPDGNDQADVKFYGCSGQIGQFDAGKNNLIVLGRLNLPNLPLATLYDSLESGDLYYCDGPGLTGVFAYTVYVK